MNDETADPESESQSQNSSTAPSLSHINSRGEFDFIASLRQRARSPHGSSYAQASSSLVSHPSALLIGIGDDAAVVRQQSGREMVATTDLLIEDIDFRRDSIPPLLLGHKALAVSLSDIAAMGARPRWAMVSLAVPRQVWENDFVDRFYDGVFALADLYDVRVVGGDTSRTEQTITINSTLIGECETGSAVTRAGAQVGDQIFVTGSLGGSGAGLRLLERGARLDQNGNAEADGPMIRQLLMRHACPQPRIGWGVVLGEERLATAMIDVSDGLSSDLNQLCNESKVGARVDSAALPVDPLLTELCGRRALDPLLLALNGGEDFELLFTVRPGDVERLPTRVDGITVTRIGEITPESDRIQISEKDRVWELEPGGFDHFRTNR